MLNDRDEKYEAPPEDSEYHFSDDDISYEVEPETAKPAASPATKENIFNRLSRSRRMLISLGVFLVLVFIVYKMVTPGGSQTPSTEINPIQPLTQQQPTPAAPALATTEPIEPVITRLTPPPTVSPPTQAPVVQEVPVQPVATVSQPPATYAPAPNNNQQVLPPQNVMLPPTQSAATATEQQAIVAQQPMAQQVPVMQPSMQPGQQVNNALPPNSIQPSPMAQQQPQQQAMQQQAMQQQALQQQAMQQQAMQQQAMQQQPQQVIQPMGQAQTVMAVPVAPTYVHETSGTSPLSQQVPGGIDASMAALNAQNQKLIAQFQAEYAQRMNEYASQNKNLNEQLQQLNTRVAGMESEMHKLLQTLTKQVNAVSKPAPVREVPVQVSAPRIAYNVQAIIPGRAWLRSDSGDTVTVAEGDLIKNVGRVVKIDPYDGVVEINTGTRVVSLSYGNGG